MIKLISLIMMALAIAGCNSPQKIPKPVCKVISGRNVPVYAVRTVRDYEIIKIYKTGRRIDSNNPNIMHEAGEMYVISRSPVWNLRPNIPVADPTFKNHLRPVNIHNENMKRQQVLLQNTNLEMHKLGLQMLENRKELQKTGKIAKDKKDLKPLIEQLEKEQGDIKRKLAELKQ